MKRTLANLDSCQQIIDIKYELGPISCCHFNVEVEDEIALRIGHDTVQVNNSVYGGSADVHERRLPGEVEHQTQAE